MAAGSRYPRDGKHLQVLGYYNPPGLPFFCFLNLNSFFFFLLYICYFCLCFKAQVQDFDFFFCYVLVVTKYRVIVWLLRKLYKERNSITSALSFRVERIQRRERAVLEIA